jgi:23S rRNA (adenine2503-C2)-methyltransferase
MGEPLANLDNVIETIRVATEPAGLAIDGRAITVCTAGIPRGIRRLGREAPKVRLGISITSARQSVRRALMPIDSAYPLDEVLEAVADHARLTRLAPMWAITPLEKVNDFEDDALELARLARKFAESTGIRPRISIVPYNPIDPPGQPQFARSSAAREYAFRKILSDAGLASHLRYSGGADIQAACGQLAGSTGG